MPNLDYVVLCTSCSLIADSAPHINTVIIVGCILMLGACYLLGIDSANPDADNDIFLTAEEVNQSTLNARNDRYASVCTVSQAMSSDVNLCLVKI